MYNHNMCLIIPFSAMYRALQLTRLQAPYAAVRHTQTLMSFTTVVQNQALSDTAIGMYNSSCFFIADIYLMIVALTKRCI